MRIVVAGTGYVGLSISVFLAQHDKVKAVDIVPEKVELINQRKSPIQDDYIEKYLAEKELDLVRHSMRSLSIRAGFVVIAVATTTVRRIFLVQTQLELLNLPFLSGDGIEVRKV